MMKRWLGEGEPRFYKALEVEGEVSHVFLFKLKPKIQPKKKSGDQIGFPPRFVVI